MTLTQNPPQFVSKYTITEAINQSESLSDLKSILRTQGCSECPLGAHKQLKGPVLFRGNPAAKIMVIGEAPGLEEDLIGNPFVGPAGRKLDEIFASVNLDTNQDCYLCNIVSCRPIADAGSGKQNNTPTTDSITACKQLLYHQISTVSPKFIVLVGGSAIKAFFPKFMKVPVKGLVGRFLTHEDFPNITFFGIYHPAAIIRAGEGTAYNIELRTATWEHIQAFKHRVDEGV